MQFPLYVIWERKPGIQSPATVRTEDGIKRLALFTSQGEIFRFNVVGDTSGQADNWETISAQELCRKWTEHSYPFVIINPASDHHQLLTMQQMHQLASNAIQ